MVDRKDFLSIILLISVIKSPPPCQTHEELCDASLRVLPATCIRVIHGFYNTSLDCYIKDIQENEPMCRMDVLWVC